MSYLTNKKILVTGGSGFLGSYVIKKLKEVGIKEKNIFSPSSKNADLRNKAACNRVVKNIDVVIHLAAKVGGIGFNREKPGELFYENIVMGVQLMEAARLSGVKKFVALGTVCAYPKFAEVPFKESELWEGYPEETNAPYGLAKKMLLVQAQAYRKQYGFNAIYLLPVNLYGPRDNFNPQASHVVPALIKKVADAKAAGADHIDAWGTGSATREFLFAGDAAEGIVLAAERYNKTDPVNLGSGHEISIKNLIELICSIMKFKGEIRWDKSQPDGQPRRMLDVSRAKKEFGFKAKTNFKKGLKETIDWYLSEHKLQTASLLPRKHK